MSYLGSQSASGARRWNSPIHRAASAIAVGAIRYFMLKFSRGKLIVFDIEEAMKLAEVA